MNISTNPAPMMSATAVTFITERMLAPSGRAKYILEYGSGGSTVYFTNKLAEAGVGCDYIAVERNFAWFETLKKRMNAALVEQKQWGVGSYLRYLLRGSAAHRWVPRECRRLLRCKIGMLKRLPAFILMSRDERAFFGQQRARCDCGGGSVKCDLYYIHEDFKDQCGESPNKYLYINHPLKDLIAELERGRAVHLCAIIDGGPRADIVERMYALMHAFPNLAVEIFLLEAGRGVHAPALRAQPAGRFIAAKENRLIDGQPYLLPATIGIPSPCTHYLGADRLDYALNTEMWYFSNSD